MRSTKIKLVLSVDDGGRKNLPYNTRNNKILEKFGKKIVNSKRRFVEDPFDGK